MTALERYVRKVADLMRLGEWDITVTYTKDDVEGRMDVDEWFAGPARLELNRQYWKNKCLTSRRWLVVHEMMHLHLKPFAYRHKVEEIAEEIMVDRLTGIIAPHMPLPPKVAKA